MRVLPLLSVAVPLVFGGCASLSSLSSGEVGCPASRIVITDDSGPVGNVRTWSATCESRVFYCSAAGNRRSCTEKVSPPATTSEATAGCQYDTQCKGARVCRASVCADP